MSAASQRIEALHGKRHGGAEGRIRIGVSAWAPDMCSPELLRDVRALQQKLDTVATIHLNQIWGEVAAVKNERGCLPTEYLDDLGFLNDRLIAAHCRCMVPQEEKRAGRAPRSRSSFNSGIAARRGLSPRIADLEAVSAAASRMGTDNMAEDMVEVHAHGPVHGARAPRRTAASQHPSRSTALGDRQWLSRDGNCRWRLRSSPATRPI